MMPSVEKLEEYLDSIEEVLSSSLAAATTELPDIRETVNRLWVDISRYGPELPHFPNVHIPGLGDFEVPPPPPPPPPVPKSLIERSTDWVQHHPRKAAGLAVGIVGFGLLVGYGGAYISTRKATIKTQGKTSSKERRQVVVVLGGDTPLALPLILDLEKKGYIVITSVSTPEACDHIEKQCHGYVRALVLDPTEPTTVPLFLRALSSTLSRRFPINASGDPHASPSTHPYIHSLISLLTLSPSHSTSRTMAPLEHVSLQSTYLPYLTATHIVPLTVIQALLPLFRNARHSDNSIKPIVVCVPATSAHIGIAFSSVQSMSAAATLRGVEILRREIGIAALTGKDGADGMKNIKVVVVDVGTFDKAVTHEPHDVYRSMENWTPSEKVTYGPSFLALAAPATPNSTSSSYWQAFVSVFRGTGRYGVPRRPTDPSVLVNALVDVVSGGSRSTLVGAYAGGLRRWVRGDRFSVGAGAATYAIASHLPSVVLNTLLNIPHILISIRNALLPAQPFVIPPSNSFPPTTAQPQPSTRQAVNSSTSDSTSEPELSRESGSEADVESNSGSGADEVESSWVSLRESALGSEATGV